MAIERNAGGGNHIDKPGEYKVKVIEVKNGMTKQKLDLAGNPAKDEKGNIILPKAMLTVAFQTDDDKKIAARFVKGTFSVKALDKLKSACGIALTAGADDLLGKECGIKVETQKPTPDGRIFMQIVGYGKTNEVEADINMIPNNDADDNIPF